MKILFFLCVLLLFSCKKYNLEKQHPELIGDYEWYYSFKDVGDSYSFDTVTDKYGLRIKDNSKILLFKNGEIIFKEKIIDILVNENEVSIILENDMRFVAVSETVSTNFVPFSGYSNMFNKTP